MQLPPCLTALDASCCVVLSNVSFPFGQRVPCRALNLKGCRSLEASAPSSLFGAATSDVVRNLHELDLSSTSRLGKEAVARALGQARALETLSLRYVATDEALLAISQSVAGRTSLRFLDVSFSPGLSDAPCEALVDAAPRLERLNLRACSNVSAGIYNGTPITLSQRISGRDVSLSSEYADDLTRTRSRRKGDNMFFFCAS